MVYGNFKSFRFSNMFNHISYHIMLVVPWLSPLFPSETVSIAIEGLKAERPCPSPTICFHRSWSRFCSSARGGWGQGALGLSRVKQRAPVASVTRVFSRAYCALEFKKIPDFQINLHQIIKFHCSKFYETPLNTMKIP